MGQTSISHGGPRQSWFSKTKELYITMNQLRADDTKPVKTTASSSSLSVKGSTGQWLKHTYLFYSNGLRAS